MLCALQTLAIIFFLGIVAFSLFVISSIHEIGKENAKFQIPHVTHISFKDKISLADTEYNKDYIINVDLKIEYPRGILIVNDPVTISGIADAREVPKMVSSYMAGFYNAQVYPETADNNGITKLANINFYNRGNNILAADETKIRWTLEGAYQPVTRLRLETIEELECTPVKSALITVHPKSIMVQIISNRTNINLAAAAYFLGVIGALDIIYRLWNSP